MKLILALALTAALFAGLFVVPIDGRTLWQRAQSRGLPQSAARSVSAGAHAALRWAEEKRDHAGDAAASPRKTPHKEVARAASPAAHAQFGEARYRNGPPAPGAAERDSEADDAAPATLDTHAAPAPAPGHDHIVAAPAQEKLGKSERQGLDQLIAAHGR